MAKEKIQQVDEINGKTREEMQHLMYAANIQGGAIASWKDGVISTMPIGKTRDASPKPVTEGTVFGAASLSKPVFAYLVLKLIEDNKINPGLGLFHYDFNLTTPLYEVYRDEHGQILSDDENPFLKRFDKNGQDNAKKLTAEMVLSHRTGLHIHDQEPFRFQFNPGENYAYSGPGILCLQGAIETVTGYDLETLAQENIFGPGALNLPNSTYEPASIFDAVLQVKIEPELNQMRPGELVLLNEQGQLTAFWLENGKMVNGSFPGSLVPHILQKLPEVGEPSNDTDLINAITLQYECAPQPNAANSLSTTAEEYVQFITSWINDERLNYAFKPGEPLFTMENDFFPESTDTPVAKGRIGNIDKTHVTWGLGVGLVINNKMQVIGAYHTGDMDQWRAGFAAEIIPDDKSRCLTTSVYFANGHNGHMLAAIFPKTLKPALDYFYSTYGFARKVVQLNGTNYHGLNYGILNSEHQEKADKTKTATQHFKEQLQNAKAITPDLLDSHEETTQARHTPSIIPTPKPHG